jgi:hypothetical protein|tara:strand:+ start:502 stop:990 length:489 start_codon:yes stop_codon:yes gene_type:complete
MSTLGFSDYKNNSNQNTTRKHRPSINYDKLKKIKHTLHTNEESDDEDDYDRINLATTTPKHLSQPESQNSIRESMQNLKNNDVQQQNWGHTFNNAEIYNKKADDNIQINNLMEKMNNIILLLEENQDEKKGSVMEEVILYCFLGIFIIYLVDSFVKVGKYVR